MADPQVGAVGLPITVTLRDAETGALIDLSSTTTRYLYLTKPGGRSTRYTASLVSGGTTGQMQYITTSANDLSVPGDWTIQARYVTPGGTFPSKRGTFVVLPNSY